MRTCVLLESHVHVWADTASNNLKACPHYRSLILFGGALSLRASLPPSSDGLSFVLIFRMSISSCVLGSTRHAF